MLEPDICSACLRYKRPRYEGQPYCYCAFSGGTGRRRDVRQDIQAQSLCLPGNNSTTTILQTDNSIPLTLGIGGTKHDTGKPPLTLVPRAALEAIARVFAFGMKKYSRDNYKKGFEYTRLMDAAMRHIVQAVDGEDTDPESGESHVAHALCCLSMLLECQRLGTLTDNRYKKGATDESN